MLGAEADGWTVGSSATAGAAGVVVPCSGREPDSAGSTTAEAAEESERRVPNWALSCGTMGTSVREDPGARRCTEADARPMWCALHRAYSLVP